MLWRRYHDRRRAGITAARAEQFLGAGITGIGAAELLLWDVLGGLWLMLIGWFLISAADVMTADPQVAPPYLAARPCLQPRLRTARS